MVRLHTQLSCFINAVIKMAVHFNPGTSEAISTYKALEGIRPTKRPFVLTRSNYPGVGAYAAHWNGILHISID